MKHFLVLVLTAAPMLAAPALISSLKTGPAAIQSVGPLAFGPEGILFAGDPSAASVFALATGDTKASKAPTQITDVQGKIAALLGSSADQIIVNDMAVNPASGRPYFSVSRGRGPDAKPVIVRVADSGQFEELSLAPIAHASVALPNAPAADAKDRRGQSLRLEAITDVGYVDGKVIVAGLSNEEFASNLRVIPFPFQQAGPGSSIEIFHGAHGRFETNAPVRTFTFFKEKGQTHLLAAYTCTPLVRFPLTELKPGNKVKGTTIAELGNRNRPLDMVWYEKGGQPYVLMNNSSRGVMKIKASALDSYPSITAPTDITGVPYETIADWKGVEQLDGLNSGHALMLVRGASSLDLVKVALP